jgi:hypothetical protein
MELETVKWEELVPDSHDPVVFVPGKNFQVVFGLVAVASMSIL